MHTPQPHRRYALEAEILFRHWEETIIFHTGSSDTFRLDALAAFILQQLQAGPADAGTLAAAAARQYEVDEPTQLTAAIELKLRDLLRMDLIGVAAA